MLTQTVNAQLGGALNKVKPKSEESKKGKEDSNNKFATPHSGQFSDERGVSGLYTLWRPWVIQDRKPGANTGKEYETNTINLDYNVKDMIANFYLKEDQSTAIELKIYSGEPWIKSMCEGSGAFVGKYNGHQNVSPSNTESKISRTVMFFQLKKDVIVMGSFNFPNKEPFDVKVTVGEESMLNIMAKDPDIIAGYTYEQLKLEAEEKATELWKIYHEAKAGKTKLLERRNTDPELTKEADAFMRQAAKDDPAGDWSAGYMYTYIHGKDWGVNYADKAKTIPKYRMIAIIGVSTSNEQAGKCFYQPGWLQQDWNGTSYGPTYFAGYGGGKVHLNCENAELYK